MPLPDGGVSLPDGGDGPTRDRALVVEFVGLPASGKTTLARAVAEHLRAGADGTAGPGGEPVTTASDRREDQAGALTAAGMVAASALRAPLRSARFLRGVHASGQDGARRSATYVGYQLYLWGELRAVADQGGIHLSDQGFLQHLWRIHLTAETDDDAYLRRLAGLHYPHHPTDLVVFVDVDHETRMRRGVQRGTDVDEELFDPDHPAIVEDRETYRAITELVPAVVADLEMDVETMTVDNADGTLAANAESVRDRVLEVERRRD